jgi:hypothetical protein
LVAILASVAVAACLIAAAGRAPKGDLRFDGALYGIAVTFEVAAIVIAAIVLSRMGKQSLIPPAVVVIVGLHFIGLWTATADDVFAWLTLALCVVGAVGAVAPPAIRLAICGFGSALALWAASAWSIFA